MRKAVLTLFAVAIVFSYSSLYAVTKTLIDFNQYDQKLASDPAFAADSQSQQNGAAQNAGAPANAQQAAPAAPQAQNGQQAQSGTGIPEESQFKLTPDDMTMSHWMVVFNSSARQISNVRYSFVKPIQTKGLVGPVRTVLGARIHFPTWEHIASAQIVPPYEIPAYNAEGKPSFVENGVINNTGDLVSITTEVYGRNFNYAFYIQLKNENGEIEKYYMGQLAFNGWRKLVWKNPNYIDNVDLRDLKRLPIFPDRGIPYKKVDSFLIIKNELNPGGDYLFYIGNISVNYDLAVLAEDEDIDQDGSWHILADVMKKQAEQKAAVRANAIELRKAEEKKMALSRGENPDASGQNNANGNNNNTNAAAQQPAPAAAPAA